MLHLEPLPSTLDPLTPNPNSNSPTLLSNPGRLYGVVASIQQEQHQHHEMLQQRRRMRLEKGSAGRADPAGANDVADRATASPNLSFDAPAHDDGGSSSGGVDVAALSPSPLPPPLLSLSLTPSSSSDMLGGGGGVDSMTMQQQIQIAALQRQVLQKRAQQQRKVHAAAAAAVSQTVQGGVDSNGGFFPPGESLAFLQRVDSGGALPAAPAAELGLGLGLEMTVQRQIAMADGEATMEHHSVAAHFPSFAPASTADREGPSGGEGGGSGEGGRGYSGDRGGASNQPMVG